MDRLDALIESTMALAKDVKPQSISDLAPVVGTAEQALADTSNPIPAATTMFAIVSEHVFPFLRNMAEADSAHATHMKGARFTIPTPTSERDQILQRVSNFRAHQEKMAREREDYYLQVKAKMLAGIDPDSASGPKTSVLLDLAAKSSRPVNSG
jgi:hypothetical protein